MHFVYKLHEKNNFVNKLQKKEEKLYNRLFHSEFRIQGYMPAKELTGFQLSAAARIRRRLLHGAAGSPDGITRGDFRNGNKGAV